MTVGENLLDRSLSAKLAEFRAIQRHRELLWQQATTAHARAAVAEENVSAARSRFMETLDPDDYEAFVSATQRSTAAREANQRIGLLNPFDWSELADHKWSATHPGRIDLARDIVAACFEKLRPLVKANEIADTEAATKAGLDLNSSSQQTRDLQAALSYVGSNLTTLTWDGVAGLIDHLFPEPQPEPLEHAA